MSTLTQPTASQVRARRPVLWNLANQITIGRFLLSIVYFILLGIAVHLQPEIKVGDLTRRWLLDWSTAIFFVAAITDALDGYIARKRNEETDFGRVADPFVDKIIVCGSFAFFLSLRETQDMVYAWMLVLLLAREFLISGIRGLMEARGIPFGASIWGKQKMILQCVTVTTVLVYAAHFYTVKWAWAFTAALVWLTVLSTFVSGIAYTFEARRLFSQWRVTKDGEPVPDEAPPGDSAVEGHE